MRNRMAAGLLVATGALLVTMGHAAEVDPEFLSTLRIPADHPRLLLTRQDIPVLRSRCKGTGPAARDYQQLKRTVDEWLRDFEVVGNWTQAPTQALACALVYHVEGEEEYASLAKRYLDHFMEKGTFIQYRSWGQLNIACDWLYDSLTEEERARYLGMVAQYAADMAGAKRQSAGHYPKYFPSNLNAVHGAGYLSAGLVLYGDRDHGEQAKRLLSTHGKFFREFMLPSFNIAAGSTGGWHEDYGHYSMASTMLVLMEFWKTATGQDIWEDSGYARGYATFIACVTRGDGSLAGISYRGEETSPSVPLSSWGASPAPPLLLARNYQDRLAQHLFHKYLLNSSLYVSLFWRVMFYAPSVKPASPSELKLPLAFHFDGQGKVVMRSGWHIGTRESPCDDTFAYLQCGDWYHSHQERDQGSFTIFKRAPLAADPDSRAMKDGHHNAIVIDGEPQQTGEADYAKSIANTPADIGDILAFEHNEDFDYVLADVTRAHDPDKVAACTRQFVYLRPDCFVVFDRVFTKDDGPRKEWVINTYGTIAVRNDVAVIDGGLSKLFVEVLLPDDAVLETSRPEGSWRKKVSRLSVRPRLPAREDYFLHVLFATAGEDEVPEAKLVRDGERVGAEVTYRDRVYRTLFDKTTGPGGHMTIIDSGGKKLANRDFTDRILEPS